MAGPDASSSTSPSPPPGPSASRLPDDPTGADRAADLQFVHLYDELKALAQAHIRREPEGHTLTPTALVNEAYLRIAAQRNLDGAERTRFLAVAAKTMRRVLVDHARGRLRAKRGGDAPHVSLDDVEPFLSQQEAEETMALDAAIERLAAVNPRGATVVEHRFFGGLTLEETAALLETSTKTVQRDWLAARAWLRKEVQRESGPR
jgi:RNA polymerase sigma factor (TIGR02999 family)